MNKGNGILGGIIILLVGIGLLWWNEGNNVSNLQSIKEGYKNYTDVSSKKVDTKYDGKLVATHGKLIVNGEISDDEFGVKTTSAVLKRTVEMYQWEEECENDNCTYKKVWSDRIIDSEDFDKEGHENPNIMPYDSETFTSENAYLGAYNLPEELLKRLPAEHKIKDLNHETATSLSMTIDGRYYTNVNSEEGPKIGDVRVSFYDNNSKNVSVLAMQTDDSFKVYKAKKGKDLFRIYEGTYDGHDILTMISKQNNFMKWLWRIVGTLLVISGVAGLFGPITNLTNKVPILGNIVGFATSTVSSVLGLAISLLVIAIAWFRFRPIVSIILIIIIIALIVGLKFMPKKEEVKKTTKENEKKEK